MYNSYRQYMTTFRAFALLVFSALWGMSAYAITPAGTVITNLATVTYQDSLGNSYTAQSNESAVTVAEVYDADLLKDQSKDGMPGQQVYFPHQLTNNGNAADVFTLDITEPVGLAADDITIFRDINGNGQPDANEPKQDRGSQVTVAAGSVVNLVVAAQVPTTAKANLSLKLQATTGNDSFPEGAGVKTNTDTINFIEHGAVLVATKEVVAHDAAKSEVTYRVTVTNNGNKPLVNGAIYDFFPDFITFDGLEIKTTDARLGDIEITDAATLDAEFTADAKPDYLSGSNNRQGLKVAITNLEPRGTTRVEFTVGYTVSGGAGYSFAAGDELLNKAFVGFEGTVDAWSKMIETNIVSVALPQVYGVEAHDRSDIEADHSHDDTVTDIDKVASASVGGLAEFLVVVENTGNGTDSYRLSVANGTFPEGTGFTFLDQTGISLGDNSGPISRGEQKVVTIKAQLPANAKVSASAVTAEFTATSVGDSSKKDTVNLQLGAITSVGVDLAYGAENGSGDTDAYSGGATGAGVKTEVVAGTTVTYPLTVYNKSGVSAAYSLNAFASVTGTQNSYQPNGSLPDGFSVAFKNARGQVISATDVMPNNGSQEVTVELTVAANMLAQQYTFAVLAVNGTGLLNDAIAYQATVIDNTAYAAITLTPDGASQVEAGGVTFYDHRLENRSNVEQTITLNAARAGATGWSHVVTVTGATAGVTKDSFTGVTANGFTVVLPAGAFVDLQVKVLVPANTLGGYTDTLTLSATVGEDVKATATDLTTVIQGQVALTKSVARVNGDGSYGPSFTTRIEGVKPGEKVVWKIKALVQGSSAASNIIISDAAPEYTTMVENSAKIDGAGAGANVRTNGSNISFYVGTGADGAANKGGVLQPGESVEVTFEVLLDK